MLQTWKEKFAHKATYRDLIEALLQGGHAQQALNMCHKIKYELGIATSDHSGTVCVNMSSDLPQGLIEQKSTDSHDHTMFSDVTQPMCNINDNQGEITTDNGTCSKKACLISWSEDEPILRNYFERMACNVRVLGSQRGLDIDINIAL